MPSLKKKLLIKRISRTSFQKKSQIGRSKRGQKSKKNIFKRCKKKIVGGADETRWVSVNFINDASGKKVQFTDNQGNNKELDLISEGFDLNFEGETGKYIVESVNKHEEGNVKIVMTCINPLWVGSNKIILCDSTKSESFIVKSGEDIKVLKRNVAKFDRIEFLRDRYPKGEIFGFKLGLEDSEVWIEIPFRKFEVVYARPKDIGEGKIVQIEVKKENVVSHSYSFKVSNFTMLRRLGILSNKLR